MEGSGTCKYPDSIITKEINDKPSTTLLSIGFMHQNDAGSLCNC